MRKSQIDAGKQPGVKSYVHQLHVIDKYGAGEGARTPDPNLGKTTKDSVMTYQILLTTTKLVSK